MQLLTIFVVVLFLGVACGQEVLIEGFVAQCLGEHSSTDTSVKTAGSSGFSLLRVDYRTKSSGDIEVSVEECSPKHCATNPSMRTS